MQLRLATATPHRRRTRRQRDFRRSPPIRSETGSIIVVVATDAPLIPTQLKRLARRVTDGLGRLGSISGNGSGDIFLAFSTANPHAYYGEKPAKHSDASQ